jgi:DNA polymerase (family 10)
MENPEVVQVLEEIADLLEFREANPFRVRAYRTATRTVRDLPEPLAEFVRAEGSDSKTCPGSALTWPGRSRPW